MSAYSHGLPGLLALRHGWPQQTDYGLTASTARGLSPDAPISFESCNSATGGDDSVAGAVATATQHPVTAWIGRTSYREVNRGTGGVVGSEIWPEESSIDWTEMWSQTRGRTPTRVTVAPASSPGDFSGVYEITARLPQTRRFPVGAGRSVHLTISAASDYVGMQGLTVYGVLHRVRGGSDDDVGGSRRFAVGSTTAFAWPNLEADLPLPWCHRLRERDRHHPLTVDRPISGHTSSGARRARSMRASVDASGVAWNSISRIFRQTWYWRRAWARRPSRT